MATSDAGLKIAVAPDGSIYAAGRVYNFAKPDDGWDIRVIRFSAAGVRDWTYDLPTPSFDRTSGAAADSTGVYLVGTSSGQLDGVSSAGSFLLKLRPDGALAWIKQNIGANQLTMNAIAIGPQGGLFVAGSGRSSDRYGLLAKLDGDGDVVWESMFDPIAGVAESLAVDRDGVYVSGFHTDQGRFLQKYNFFRPAALGLARGAITGRVGRRRYPMAPAAAGRQYPWPGA